MNTICYPQQNSHWYRLCQTMLQPANIRINGDRPYDIQVSDPRFFKRVLREGSLGLGESYMDGWWHCDRLDVFFQRILQYRIDQQLSLRLVDIWRITVAKMGNLQSPKRAWIVGKEHYDLGNDLFSQILDPHMQYSCGYWHQATTLEQAQEAKLSMICDKLQLRPGMNLLDIGCGWGGLAAYAARHYGVSVVGITVSSEQKILAQQHCVGLDVVISLQDYRDLEQSFDRIVSVGMFEHVGPKNYPRYFATVERNLKPDGLFLLHSIGANHTKTKVDPWIEKYIFPNGHIPSLTQIAEASQGLLVMEDWHNFGADYDPTLMAWLQRFQQAWPILACRYGPRFKRMFEYYLNACAGAFRARDLQLWQVLFSRHGVAGGMRVPR